MKFVYFDLCVIIHEYDDEELDEQSYLMFDYDIIYYCISFNNAG